MNLVGYTVNGICGSMGSRIVKNCTFIQGMSITDLGHVSVKLDLPAEKIERVFHARMSFL